MYWRRMNLCSFLVAFIMEPLTPVLRPNQPNIQWVKVKVKAKVNFVPEQVIKTQSVSRRIALIFL
jgi:hypothetical protein